MVVQGSVLAKCVREMRGEAMTQQANVASILDEMSQVQKVAKELEGRVTELEAEK